MDIFLSEADLENFIKKNELIKNVDTTNTMHYKYLLYFFSKFNDTSLMNSLNSFFRGMSSLDVLTKKLIDLTRDVKLICFCASHINSPDRFTKLKNMLESWKNQAIKIPMIISISYSIKRHKFQKLIDTIRGYTNLTILESINTKSQFEHYKHIIDKYYDMYRDYHVIFSDDDDIWLTNRTLAFSAMIKIINLTGQCNAIIEYPFMLMSDEYMANEKNILDNKNINIINDCEYISYCVPIHAFGEFIKNCDSSLLKHKYCDRFFVKFMVLMPTSCITFKLPLFGYGYYYWNKKYNNVKNHTYSDEIDIEDVIFNYYSQTTESPIEFLNQQFFCLDMSERNNLESKFFKSIDKYKFLANSPVYNINN